MIGVHEISIGESEEVKNSCWAFEGIEGEVTGVGLGRAE
jgi:hypothetical protein